MSTCNYYITEKWAPLVVFESDDDAEIEEVYNAADGQRNMLIEGLRWYNVIIRGGYYSGIQFDVTLQDQDATAEWFEDIDDETAREFYDMTAEEIRADMARERETIKKWLRGWIGCGWLELGCAGVFSNGEAVYFQIAPRRIRVQGPDAEAEAVHVAVYNTARA